MTAVSTGSFHHVPGRLSGTGECTLVSCRSYRGRNATTGFRRFRCSTPNSPFLPPVGAENSIRPSSRGARVFVDERSEYVSAPAGCRNTIPPQITPFEECDRVNAPHGSWRPCHC
jgi:hypothetical protein